MTIPDNPSLKDLQVLWESLFWYKSRDNWYTNARVYEEWIKFFGADRKPRDIFRSDVLDYKEWLKKRGLKESTIQTRFEQGARLFRQLDERGLVELGFNPFKF